MLLTKQLLALQPRPRKKPPTLPPELLKVPVPQVPIVARQLLDDTPLQLREDFVENLVRAVNSNDEDIASRSYFSLISLGSVAIPVLGYQLLEGTKDRRYRLRLIRILGRIGQQNRQAMGPLLQLLTVTKVPEVVSAVQVEVMRINQPRMLAPGLLPLPELR